MADLASAHAAVMRRARIRFRLRPCALANRDHTADPRIFAHTHHARAGRAFIIPSDDTVCVSRALHAQPAKVQRGILWHELGHLLDGHLQPDEERPTAAELRTADRVYADRPKAERLEEARANARVRYCYGVRIRYNRDGVQEV